MNLPENFNYSQKSLQDFIYCSRLFKNRYIDRIKWPAVELNPVDELEYRAKSGAEFHRIVYQFFSGISEEKIESNIRDKLIKTWWENFKISIAAKEDHKDIYLSEARIYTFIGDFRLIAKLDLIAVKPDGRRIIYDWKTTHNRYKRKILSDHFQTKVYPYVLVSASDRIFPWEKTDPDRVKMIYWFAEYPENPEVFEFDEIEFIKVEEEIRRIIEKIDGMNPEDFTKTQQQRKCEYCVYRSLCGRGDLAGQHEDTLELYYSEKTRELEFDLDQINEIEF